MYLKSLINIMALFVEASYSNWLVQDLSTHSTLAKIFNKSQEQVVKLENIDFEINKLNEILGSTGNNAVLSGYTKDISDFIYNISAFSRGDMYALQSLFNNSSNEDACQDINWHEIQVDKELFPKIDNEVISYHEIDRVHQNRETVFKGAMQSSLTLAGSQQSTIEPTQATVLNISKRMEKSSTIHEDLVNANHTLVMVAQELVQIRLLMAKQLELFSTMYLSKSTEWVSSSPLASSSVSSTKKDKNIFVTPKIKKRS